MFQVSRRQSSMGSKAKIQLSWPENVNAKTSPFAGFLWLLFQYFCNRSLSVFLSFFLSFFVSLFVYFFLLFLFLCLILHRIWALIGGSHVKLVHSLPMKSRKKLVHDATDTCATRAGLVHDVTDTNWKTQNGSARGRIFATFKQNNNSDILGHKSTAKLPCEFLSLSPPPPFPLIRPVMLLRIGSCLIQAYPIFYNSVKSKRNVNKPVQHTKVKRMDSRAGSYKD